jgi:hypothetical protein
MFAWLMVVFFAGLVMVLANRSMDESPDKVEYRYLPRDLDSYIREEPRLAKCEGGACLGSGTFQRPPGPGAFDAMFTNTDVVRGGGWPAA